MTDRQTLHDTTEADFAYAIRSAFCKAAHASGASPISILTCALVVIRGIYDDVAAAHTGRGACPCGWRPDRIADLDAFQAALSLVAEAAPTIDLRIIQPAGRA